MNKVIILTISVILGMVAVPTIYKIYKEHNNNKVLVVEKEFLYYANKCFNEGNCSDVVYLSNLYHHDYIDTKLTNPINKKYYAEESYVNLKTHEVKLIS